jgi:hypothetical protein
MQMSLKDVHQLRVNLIQTRYHKVAFPQDARHWFWLQAKGAKAHQKDHFLPVGLWMGDLGRSPTNQKLWVYRKLESTKHHATAKSNGSPHLKKSTWHWEWHLTHVVDAEWSISYGNHIGSRDIQKSTPNLAKRDQLYQYAS